MHPCGEDVGNGTVDGYTDLTNSDCAFCDDVCEPPEIDSTIGFFDGFNGKAVGITYGVIIAFTIVYQIFYCKVQKPKIEAEFNEIAESGVRKHMNHMNSLYSNGGSSKKNINVTSSRDTMNQYQN
mmetsp:Transcript_32901/g.50309  ORF Transcript_32901/g.50309 Transcript_32901/m.50309 type:complete len:125 (-) Transcript_32901:16-390(-)